MGGFGPLLSPRRGWGGTQRFFFSPFCLSTHCEEGLTNIERAKVKGGIRMIQKLMRPVLEGIIPGEVFTYDTETSDI
ncbi:MAG: hypothetical protein AAF694_07605 [Bacteroidota bacterium]